LIDRGELTGQPLPLGTYVSLRQLVRNLRKLREEANLSLADVSAKSGMDKAMLSRLENGHVSNPGIETLSRYVCALNKDIQWRVVDSKHRQ
jgi:transcriptional regulator with XRE-family HTH domain